MDGLRISVYGGRAGCSSPSHIMLFMKCVLTFMPIDTYSLCCVLVSAAVHVPLKDVRLLDEVYVCWGDTRLVQKYYVCGCHLLHLPHLFLGLVYLLVLCSEDQPGKKLTMCRPLDVGVSPRLLRSSFIGPGQLWPPVNKICGLD